MPQGGILRITPFRLVEGTFRRYSEAMLRVGGFSIVGGRRLITVLLILLIAPGLCLALPTTASGHPAAHHGLTESPSGMHGDVSCTPAGCCAMIAKVAAKRGDELAPALVATPVVGSSTILAAVGSLSPDDPTATPPDPPERNLPLLC